MRTAFIVFAHGSRLAAANEAVFAVARALAARGGHELVEAAFLDLAQPDLPGAIDRLVGRDAERIVIIPYFLTPGRHAAEDLNGMLAELARQYAPVRIEATDTLDGHPALETAVLDRARQALES